MGGGYNILTFYKLKGLNIMSKLKENLICLGIATAILAGTTACSISIIDERARNRALENDLQAKNQLHHEVMMECVTNNCESPLECADNAVEFFVGKKQFLREHIIGFDVRRDTALEMTWDKYRDGKGVE